MTALEGAWLSVHERVAVAGAIPTRSTAGEHMIAARTVIVIGVKILSPENRGSPLEVSPNVIACVDELEGPARIETE